MDEQPTTPQDPEDQPETEGHAWRGGRNDEQPPEPKQGTERDQDDDVEGHIGRYGG